MIYGTNITEIGEMVSPPNDLNQIHNSAGVAFELINFAFIIEVVRALYAKYEFENFIYYISKSYDLRTESVSKNLNHLFEVFPLVPKIIFISDNATGTQLYHIDHFVNANTLTLVFANGPNDNVMTLAAESMKRVRILKTIFIISPQVEGENEDYNYMEEMIKQTYAWIWHEQFLYTIVLTASDQIFVLDPYPNMNILNKTGDWQVNDFFIDAHNDFRGYIVNTVIRYDLPRVFDRQRERNELVLSGTSGKLFTAFIKSINATLIDSSVASSPFEPAEMGEMVELVVNRSIEMSPHSFTTLFAIEKVGISYPIGINDWCIMVPFHNRSPEHLYLILSFQYATWLLILVAIIYISIALWLCVPRKNRNDYTSIVLHALCSLIGILPRSLFGAPNLRMRFVFFFLFMLSFLTSNWYVTKIASLLVTTLPSAQINTMEDVIRANLRIKVFDYEYERLRRMPEQYPLQFLRQLDIIDKQFMDQHRDTLNTSFGYSVQTDRWEFLNMQQEFLRKPLFRLSDICIGPFYHVFPLYSDSHLQLPFTYFIMYVSQSGFFTYWKKSAFADALRLKLVKIFLINEEPRSLSLQFLIPIWCLWALGLTIAVLRFVYEVKGESLAKAKRKLASRVGLSARKKQ